MNTIINNISKKSFDSTFATSKWSNDVVFNSKVRKQLEGDMEV